MIYGSKTTIPGIRARRGKYDAITKYIEIELEDLWAYQFLDQVKRNREAYWPTRDERTCAESHIICCNKFDFVLETMSINPFNTTHFGWIDAYLGKTLVNPKANADQKALAHPKANADQKAQSASTEALALANADQKANADRKTLSTCTTLRICENYTIATIPRILRTIADEWKSTQFHIQILNVCDKKFKDPAHKREYYNQYRWVVCGGFFVTAPDAGISILSRLKEIFVETTQAGYGHGEEMFYLEVLDEYSEQIRGTYGDYGQILDNFIYPTRNIEYVYHTILANYKSFGYEREASKLESQLLESANKSWVIIDDCDYKILAGGKTA